LVRPTTELCRTWLSPDTRGALRAFHGRKAPRAAGLFHGPRANHLASTPDGLAVSGVGPDARGVENPRRSGLCRRRRARGPAPDRRPRPPDRRPVAPAPGARQRGRAAAPRRAQRGRGGAATGHRRRDAWYLRRGRGRSRTGRAFVAAARRSDPLGKAIRLVLRPKEWMADLTNALDVPVDAALEDVGDAAKTLAVGEGGPIAAAAAVAAVSLQKRPDGAALARCLADAVLARRRPMAGPGAADRRPDSSQRFAGGGATGG
jgi:hypothetical protein